MEIIILGNAGEGKTLMAEVIKAVVLSQHKTCIVDDEYFHNEVVTVTTLQTGDSTAIRKSIDLLEACM